MLYFEDNFPGWSSGVNFKKSVSVNGLTTNGNNDIDFSASTGAFKFPTGAATGQVESVIQGQGATATLTAAQSGATVLFDRAAGIVYTLPAPVVGLTFTFVYTVTVTSNAYKVITNTGTVFLKGGVTVMNNGAASGESFGADGSTIVAFSSNGTTTGGIQGGAVVLTCLSSTLWAVSGSLTGSGTVATPFATS